MDRVRQSGIISKILTTLGGAEDYKEKLRQLNSSDLDAYENLARNYLLADAIEEAESALRRTPSNLKINPILMEALAGLKAQASGAQAEGGDTGGAPQVNYSYYRGTRPMTVLDPRPMSSTSPSPARTEFSHGESKPRERTISPIPDAASLHAPLPQRTGNRARLIPDEIRAWSKNTVEPSTPTEGDEPIYSDKSASKKATASNILWETPQGGQSSKAKIRAPSTQMSSIEQIKQASAVQEWSNKLDTMISTALDQDEVDIAEKLLGDAPPEAFVSVDTVRRFAAASLSGSATLLDRSTRSGATVQLSTDPGNEIGEQGMMAFGLCWEAVINGQLQEATQRLLQIQSNNQLFANPAFKVLAGAVLQLLTNSEDDLTLDKATSYDKMMRFTNGLLNAIGEGGRSPFALSKAFDIVKQDLSVGLVFNIIFQRKDVERNDIDHIKQIFDKALSRDQETVKEKLSHTLATLKIALHMRVRHLDPVNQRAWKDMTDAITGEIRALKATDLMDSIHVRGTVNLIKMLGYLSCIKNSGDLTAPIPIRDPEEIISEIMISCHPNHEAGLIGMFDTIDGSSGDMHAAFFAGNTRFGKTRLATLLGDLYGPCESIPPGKDLYDLVNIPRKYPDEHLRPPEKKELDPLEVTPEAVFGKLPAARTMRDIYTFIHEECQHVFNPRNEIDESSAKYLFDPGLRNIDITFKIKYAAAPITVRHPWNSGLYIGCSNPHLSIDAIRHRFQPYLIFNDMTRNQQKRIFKKAFDSHLECIIRAPRRGANKNLSDLELKDAVCNVFEQRNYEGAIFQEIDKGPAPAAPVIQTTVNEVLSMVAHDLAHPGGDPIRIRDHIFRAVLEKRGTRNDYALQGGPNPGYIPTTVDMRLDPHRFPAPSRSDPHDFLAVAQNPESSINPGGLRLPPSGRITDRDLNENASFMAERDVIEEPDVGEMLAGESLARISSSGSITRESGGSDAGDTDFFDAQSNRDQP